MLVQGTGARCWCRVLVLGAGVGVGGLLPWRLFLDLLRSDAGSGARAGAGCWYRVLMLV